MSEKEIISIADNADMIINGFSFTANEDGFIIWPCTKNGQSIQKKVTTRDNRDNNNKVKEENSEALDIFEPAMHNLFDAGSMVIDNILEGKI